METPHDAQEIDALLKRAYDLRINDLDTSVQLTKQAFNSAKKMENLSLLAQAQSQLGLLSMVQGEFQKALDFSEEALLYFEKTNDLKGIADAKYNIAGVHYKSDNFHLGLQYLLDCLYIYRQLNDYYNESRVLKSMGTIYEYFGDQNNAIDTYLKSVEIGQRANDPNLESNAYNPLSGIYLKLGQHDLAMETIEKSIAIKEQTKDTRGFAFALYGRGKVYLKLKNFEKAQSDFVQSLHIQIEMGDKLGLAMTYNKMGLLQYELHLYDKAKEYLLLALQITEQYDISIIRFKACYNLHLIARAQGNAPEALEYLEKYMKLKEAVINTRTYNVIKSYEAITKIEALEREAKSQRDKTDIIEKKNDELDSFFYRVSHDLKGPISSLLGLHNLTKLEGMDAQAQHYFDMYQSQILRINNIVMDLINITRMNHQEENRVKINFSALVDDCINAYHYLGNFKHISFVKEIDECIEFNSEWAIVNTILQNLIENAIKYASLDKRDPIVRTSICMVGENIKIIVEDNGQGIRSDFQSKVFNMFFRANDRVQGTGLGLYILKRAVERLHGEVTFESHLNIGSTFTVILPLSRKPENLLKSVKSEI